MFAQSKARSKKKPTQTNEAIMMRYFIEKNCLKLHGQIVFVCLFVVCSRLWIRAVGCGSKFIKLWEEKHHQKQLSNNFKVVSFSFRKSLCVSRDCLSNGTRAALFQPKLSWSFQSNYNVYNVLVLFDGKSKKKLKQINCVMGFVIFSLFKLLIFVLTRESSIGSRERVGSIFFGDPFR